jgi:hypothetical protein
LPLAAATSVRANKASTLSASLVFDISLSGGIYQPIAEVDALAPTRRIPMTGTYKQHLITSIAQLNPQTRRSNPKVSILCPSEGGTQRMKRVLFKQSFDTPEEAEREGVAFARKWIDDGKPDLSDA